MDYKIETARQVALAEFLKEYAGEEDDERRCAQEALEAKLKPIEEEFTAKNGENRERAVDKAKALTEKLLDEYVAGMQKKIKRIPDMNANTLEVFHDEQVEKLEQMFGAVTLGVEAFQEQWLDKLRKGVEGEYGKFQMSLESILANALDMVAAEISNYEQVLNGLADEMTAPEFEAFHEKSVKNILAAFPNPFPASNPKSDEIAGKLRDKLEDTYMRIIQDGSLFKKKRMEQMENAVGTCLAMLQEDLEASFQSNQFMKPDACHAFLNTSREKSLQLLVSQAEDADVEQKTLENLRDIFAAKADEMLSHFKKQNEMMWNLALLESDMLLSECTEDYERGIRRSVKNFVTIDELLEEHEKMKQNVISRLKKSLTSTQKLALINEYTQKLEARLQQVFQEVKGFFLMKQKADGALLMTALHDARKIYQENMDRKFTSNAMGYFELDELDKTDSHLREAVKKNMDPTLTNDQVQKLDLQLDKLYLKYKERNELVKDSYDKTEPALGIDLGTTYCCVAVYQQGSVRILRNSLGANTTPSYVTINQDGSTLVGTPAKEQAFRNPEATIFDAKRIIGRRLDDECLQEDMKFWPFVVEEVDGRVKIRVRDDHYNPEEISAMILRSLKDDAEKVLGVEVKKAVITVPAYFSDGQRQATIDAGEMAGLEVLGILNEPTAAAVAYRLEWYNPGKPRKILVYDLGGGTFDVAVLQMSDDKMDVLSINGNSHLGGEDFDKNMMQYCAVEFYKTSAAAHKKGKGRNLFDGKDSPKRLVRDDTRRRLKRLQFYCENAKKSLTNTRKLDSPYAVAIHQIVSGEDLCVEISRRIFDDRNMALFQQTITIVDKALQSAGVTKEEIDDVVMVGGSTRINKLQEMLAEHFKGKILNNQMNPDEAVAHGAAVQAAILSAKPGSKLFDFGMIQEITPMSLGVEISTGAMDVIIPKNTKIPSMHTQVYQTCTDDQTSVTIQVFQGEELQVARANKLLGTFRLEGIPPGPAEKEIIDVTMKIDQNGILSVEAVCRSNQGRNSITVCEEKGRLSENEKRRLMNKEVTAEKKRLLKYVASMKSLKSLIRLFNKY